MWSWCQWKVKTSVSLSPFLLKPSVVSEVVTIQVFIINSKCSAIFSERLISTRCLPNSSERHQQKLFIVCVKSSSLFSNIVNDRLLIIRQSDNHYWAAERQLQLRLPQQSQRPAVSKLKKTEEMFSTFPAMIIFSLSLNTSWATDIMGIDITSASDSQRAGIFPTPQIDTAQCVAARVKRAN